MAVDSSHIPFIAVSNSFVDLTRKHLKKCTFRFPYLTGAGDFTSRWKFYVEQKAPTIVVEAGYYLRCRSIYYYRALYICT